MISNHILQELLTNGLLALIPDIVKLKLVQLPVTAEGLTHQKFKALFVVLLNATLSILFAFSWERFEIFLISFQDNQEIGIFQLVDQEILAVTEQLSILSANTLQVFVGDERFREMVLVSVCVAGWEADQGQDQLQLVELPEAFQST